jgi:hypothetical protein
VRACHLLFNSGDYAPDMPQLLAHNVAGVLQCMGAYRKAAHR